MGRFVMSKTKVWRAIPLEVQDKPYIERITALSANFISRNGKCSYNFPQPETEFEKEIYAQFQELITSYSVDKIEYVVPLIKEFIIDNQNNIAIVLLRYQMDFAIGKGFQMKEILFKARKGEKLKEFHEEHMWFGPTDLDYDMSRTAKINLDPMLYLLKGCVLATKDVDLFGLTLCDDKLSFSREYGESRTLSL